MSVAHIDERSLHIFTVKQVRRLFPLQSEPDLSISFQTYLTFVCVAVLTYL
jgi:hypothetical protein